MKDWNPIPVRRIFIPKPDSRQRPLGIPTIIDRIWQNVAKNALEPEWEAKFEDSSYGFRPSRSVDDAINRIFVSLAKKVRIWVVDADISACFDNIDHDFLLKQLEHFPARSITKKWLKAGVIIENKFEESPRGSFLLCNIALHGMEADIKVVRSAQNFVVGPRLFVQYADDFIILTKTSEEARSALSDVEVSLEKRGLEISKTKTRISPICEGFDFLGFNIKMNVKDGSKYAHIFRQVGVLGNSMDYQILEPDNTGLYIHPSEKSIRNFKLKIKEIFTQYKQAEVKTFIVKLNPVIRGWANSKNAWHSNRTFHKLDNYIFNLCWRWMRRKYGDKNATWMKKRYYRHLKAFGINNRWVFTDPKTGIFLMQLKWTGIQRHIMIKNNACPDDPNKIDYFKTRRGLNIERNINPFSVLQKSLAISHDHICPLCNTSLYNGEKLHRHHIVAYADGGPTTFNNLVLIHLPCHNKITFDKRPERREETKEWLLIYKQNHPNRLTAYLKKLKSNVIPENNSVDFLD